MKPALLLFLSCRAFAWNSVFLQPHARPRVHVQGRAFQLDDYSYAGYRLSEKGLGDGLRCASLKISAKPGADITSMLARALESFSGSIILPAGTFKISKTLWIKNSEVRIQGQGSDKTILVISSDYNPGSKYYEAPFSFNAEGNPWIPVWMQESKALAATSSSDILRGGMILEAGSNAGFAAGDWVVVQQLFWDKLSKAAGAGAWPTRYESNDDWRFSLTYVRKIAGIAGKRVTLDAPLPMSLLNANHPVRLFKPNPKYFIENVGLEGLSIRVEPNHNDAGRPAGIAVSFKSAFNAWCRDVKVSNVAKHGFQPSFSARVSFLDCSVRGAQDMGGGGFGYAFHSYASQELLYRRCVAENVRHGFSHQYPMSSDIVMSQCRSLRPAGLKTENADVDDTHLAFSQHLLWDQFCQQNTGIQAMNRGTRSGDATHETFQSGVVWNYSNDGEAFNWQAGKVQLSPAPYPAENDALVIGTQHASAWDNSEDPDPYIQGTEIRGAALQRGPHGNVAYEGIGAPGLSPASLFDAELASRLGKLPPETASGNCGP